MTRGSETQQSGRERTIVGSRLTRKTNFYSERKRVRRQAASVVGTQTTAVIAHAPKRKVCCCQVRDGYCVLIWTVGPVQSCNVRSTTFIIWVRVTVLIQVTANLRSIAESVAHPS